MNYDNSGGPAFPLPSAAYKEPIPGGTEMFGMTLRDYFAAKAMQGLFAAAENYQTKELVDYAYEVADAMLEARK